MRYPQSTIITGLACLLITSEAGARQTLPRIGVEASVASGGGRLLVFAQRVRASDESQPVSVSADPFFRKDNFVVAREVGRLEVDVPVGLDSDDKAYPGPMSALPPGDYWVQAVLDRDHDYAYRGRPDGGDLVEVRWDQVGWA